MNKFTLLLTDSVLQNRSDFLQFLSQNQGQDIVVDINKEGACLTSLGVYQLLDLFDFQSVTICTDNAVEQHPRYNIELGATRFRFFSVPASTDYSQYQHWNQSKRFGVFYNRAYWHRMGIAAHLYKHHRDQTLLNFRYNPRDAVQRQEFELDRLFRVDPISAGNFMQLCDSLPLQLEAADGYTVAATTHRHTMQLCSFYPDFLIDVVAESFVQGRTFYCTEKTVRSMLLKKPFIVMGPKCFLIHLRQMGFRTFHDYWNEDYDGYHADRKYLMILKLLDELADKSHDELVSMYQNMQDILEHNHNLLITKAYNKNITYVD